MYGHGGGGPDPEKIKEILDVVQEKVPGLLKELSEILYSPEAAKNYGVAVATFYKELRDAGMSDEEAFQLTQQYMSTLNFGKMMHGKMMAHKMGHHGPPHHGPPGMNGCCHDGE